MSENAQSNRRDRLEALLPFFLNGTLSGAELREVEEWLASDPEALASLAEAEGEYSATLADNEAIHPPADALARFSAALAEEAGPDRAALPPLASRTGGLGGRRAGARHSRRPDRLAQPVPERAILRRWRRS